MQIILTTPVKKLGKIGDHVNVKDGYGRNYLLPKKMAIRANRENIERFSSLQADLEKQDKENIAKAKKDLAKISGETLFFAAQSSADGKLFGSISSRSVAEELSKNHNLELDHNNILLAQPIKFNGIYEIKVSLHPEVATEILVVVAKTNEEAQIALQEHKLAQNKPAESAEAAAN